MVFVGRSAGELCRQIKDPKENGGRTLDQIFHHIVDDDLVGLGLATRRRAHATAAFPTGHYRAIENLDRRRGRLPGLKLF